MDPLRARPRRGGSFGRVAAPGLDGSDVERLRAWTYRRQLLVEPAASALDALRGVVAVYSSHPTAPLALAARTRAFEPRDFVRLEYDRRAIRIPAMRGSIFLVPTDNASRIFAATRTRLEARAGNLAYFGLSLDHYHRLKPRVLEALDQPRTPAEMAAALPGEAALTVVARTMAREGLVLRVGSSLRVDDLKYVGTEAWLGRPLGEENPETSLAWLAGEYLRAFGPATVEDFAWWAGIPKRRAQHAIAVTGAAEVLPRHFMAAEGLDEFESSGPVNEEALALLPKWDSYTMAYAPAGRERLLSPGHLEFAYTRRPSGATIGDGLPLVLRPGRAVATWSHRFAGNRMEVSLQPFEDEPALPVAAYEHVGRVLMASEVVLRPTP